MGGRAGSRGGVDVRFLLAASTRDEVRAGSLRFLLSILWAASAAAEIGDGVVGELRFGDLDASGREMVEGRTAPLNKLLNEGEVSLLG